jgi:hypothetical protein
VVQKDDDVVERREMESIINTEKSCYKCGNTDWVECHHIFGGTANRKLSEKYGLKVYLCKEHHMEAHEGGELTKMLHQIGQEAFEREYPYDFTRLFYGDGIEEER